MRINSNGPSYSKHGSESCTELDKMGNKSHQSRCADDSSDSGDSPLEFTNQNCVITHDVENTADEETADELETADEKKARHRSHYIVYTTQLVLNIGVTTVQSGVWDYLKELDDTVTKASLGWAVTATPIGQILSSTILGYWSNKRGSIRAPCIFALCCFIISNLMYATLYAYQDKPHHMAFYMLILTKFVLGISSANTSLNRTYIAGSTRAKERTDGLARNAVAQSLGFVIGPGIQAVVTILVPTKIETGIPGIVWDKYTAVGWVAAILGILNLIIVMPCIFQEHYIAAKEFGLTQKKETATSERSEMPRPNYRGVAAQAFCFGVLNYAASARETLSVPLIEDQYGISGDSAVFYTSIAFSISGAVRVTAIMVVTRITKQFDSRKVMICLGFVPVIIGIFLHYPIGNKPIVLANCTYVAINSTRLYNNPRIDLSYSNVILDEAQPTESIDENCYGCPIEQQPWCEYTPQITPPQLITSFLIVMFGYGIALSYSQSVYSRILGPIPLGVWMSLLVACSATARITGPIWLSNVYEHLGTKYTYFILGSIELASLILLVLSFNNLAPMSMKKTEEKNGYDNPDVTKDEEKDCEKFYSR